MVLEYQGDELRPRLGQAAALHLYEQLFQVNGVGVAAQVAALAEKALALIKGAGLASRRAKSVCR